MATMSDEELIDCAKRCVEASTAAMSEDRREARIDLQYRAGDQWPADALTSRGQARPTLTINRTNAFVNHVVNNFKLNRPGIQVSPVDSRGDIKTAEVVAGALRHIFYVSSGDLAVDMAFDSAITIGWGYYRLVSDYVDESSFDQDISFCPIANPFSVYFDPASVMFDGSDSRECVLTIRMTREQFAREYPDADPGAAFVASQDGDWVGEDDIQLAEYYYCEEVPDRLLDFGDGQLTFRSEIPRGFRRGLDPVRERPVMRRQVKYCKLTSFGILEKRNIPGRHIPIIPVYGQRLLVDGKWRNYGLVRWLRDPQKMLNYWESAKTEMLAQMPKSKWIGAAGQFAGFESSWRDANVSNEAFLEYNLRDEDGNVVGAPQRVFPDPPPQGFIEASLHIAQYMKEISNIYDASVGARSNETSGRAIAVRREQGDTANFHYFDHAQKSFRHAQRVVLSWIPVIYDAPRLLRILGEDQRPQLVPVNGHPSVEGGIPAVIHDLTIGRYDLLLSSGPSYQTRRQEAADRITQFVTSFPDIMQVAGDLLIQNLDWPGAQKIAHRLRTLLPPNLQDEESEEASPEERLQRTMTQLQEVQAQLQQINAYAQQTEQQAQQLAQENEQLKVGAEAKDRELDLKMEQLKLEANIEAQKLALQEQELQLKARAQGVQPEAFQAELSRIEQQVQAIIIALTAGAPEENALPVE